MDKISRQIIEQAQAGNQEAFSALYQATYGRNYYVALKMVKREADTEDILQDAYVKIFHNLNKFTYTGENSFASWTTKIVSNTALDFLRRKSPVLFSEMENEDGEIDFDIEDVSVESRPDLSLDQKETSRIVQELLDELSDEQRICTILYYVEQLSIAEIAEQCECSEGTIKSRLRYARIKLQGQGERLEREGIHLKHIAPMAILLLLLQQEMAQAAKRQVPVLKLGCVLPENMPENLPGNPAEDIATKAQQEIVSTVQKTISKKLAVLLVAGGIILGAAGSYVVQGINGGGGEDSRPAVTPTLQPDVSVMPTAAPEAGGSAAHTETPEEMPAETPENGSAVPTAALPTEKPSPKPTEKRIPKQTPKPDIKPTPKGANATKRPSKTATPKPTVKATKKPKKTATPRPTKKPSDNQSDSTDWDDDYVDWEE